MIQTFQHTKYFTPSIPAKQRQPNKLLGLLLAMVHKKNNSNSMFMHPHKPHVSPFLPYLLNQLHHS